MGFINFFSASAILISMSVAQAVVADEAKPDAKPEVKPIDLSLPQTSPSSRPRAHKLGLHGGAKDLLNKTTPVDAPVDDATKEGKLKTYYPVGTLPVGPVDNHAPVYDGSSPNLPGTPGVLNH